MNNRWFLIPTIGTGEDRSGYKPKYVEDTSAIMGWSGRRTGNDRYIVRVFGENSALEKVGSKEDIEIPDDSTVEEKLENITGKGLTVSEWEERFDLAIR